jgi:hypothetical protein
VKPVELGCPGHLIVAQSCQWRRHTQVGHYRVSTLGNYFLRGQRETLGAAPDSFFETMVFRTIDRPESLNEGCGCMVVETYDGLEQARYATAGEAQAGHERMVAKYLALSEAVGLSAGIAAHAGHFIERCRHCGGVISQCRCPARDKEVRYGVCATCRQATRARTLDVVATEGGKATVER